MENKKYFIDYFNPCNIRHIEWYAFHRKHGCWPKEMMEEIEGIKLSPLDPINVAIKISDQYLENHEKIKQSQAAMFAGKKPGER